MGLSAASYPSVPPTDLVLVVFSQLCAEDTSRPHLFVLKFPVEDLTQSINLIQHRDTTNKTKTTEHHFLLVSLLLLQVLLLRRLLLLLISIFLGAFLSHTE